MLKKKKTSSSGVWNPKNVLNFHYYMEEEGLMYFLLHLPFCFSEAKPTLPANFEEDTWAKLKSAISAIFLKQPDPIDSEILYQVVSAKSFLLFNWDSDTFSNVKFLMHSDCLANALCCV